MTKWQAKRVDELNDIIFGALSICSGGDEIDFKEIDSYITEKKVEIFDFDDVTLKDMKNGRLHIIAMRHNIVKISVEHNSKCAYVLIEPLNSKGKPLMRSIGLWMEQAQIEHLVSELSKCPKKTRP